MKEAYYFQHDYNARNDDKILELRASEFGNEGVAVFWYCLETMAERGDGLLIGGLIGGLSLGYGVPKDWLERFLKYCVSIGLFTEDKKGISNKRLTEHLLTRRTLSEAGKSGAKKRWQTSQKNSQAIATPLPPLMQRKGKERKEKERDICPASPDPTPSVIEEFNRLTGASYRLTPDKRRQVRERLKSFGREDVTRAILNRLNDRNSMGANPTGKVWARDWNSLFRNDANFDRALNLAGSVVIDDAFYQKEMSELGVVKFKTKYGESLALKFYKFSSL